MVKVIRRNPTHPRLETYTKPGDYYVMSEGAHLDLVAEQLRDVLDWPSDQPGTTALPQGVYALVELALESVQKLRAQIGSGIHANPRRVVETPGARGGAMKVHGIVGDVVYEIRYRHGEDAEDYVHKFETPASLWALEGGGLLIESETHRLWDDF